MENNNVTPSLSFTLRLNQFSDMSDSELSNLFSEIDLSNEEQTRALNNVQTVDIQHQLFSRSLLLPVSINWADSNNNPTGDTIVSPVGNQGLCGACWAYTAVYATEASVRLSSGQKTSLSIQELLDCDTNLIPGIHILPRNTNNGCSGGNPIRAFR